MRLESIGELIVDDHSQRIERRDRVGERVAPVRSCVTAREPGRWCRVRVAVALICAPAVVCVVGC